MSKLKSFVQKGAFAVTGLTVSAVTFAQEAPALDEAVGDAFASVTSQFSELMATYGWPLIALITGTFVLVRIVKRVLRSA